MSRSSTFSLGVAALTLVLARAILAFPITIMSVIFSWQMPPFLFILSLYHKTKKIQVYFFKNFYVIIVGLELFEKEQCPSSPHY